MNIFEKFKKPNKESSGAKYLKEDYWFETIKSLAKNYNEVPDPIQIRAAAIIEALGISSGPYSALEVGSDNEKDKIIAKYLTNAPGVVVDTSIFSHDFRDIYPNGLPEELKKVLDPDTLKIMEIEYEHQKCIQRKNLKNNIKTVDCSIHYCRLPGGIDVFLKGYMHVG
jgi:hypothetical protein